MNSIQRIKVSSCNYDSTNRCDVSSKLIKFQLLSHLELLSQSGR